VETPARRGFLLLIYCIGSSPVYSKRPGRIPCGRL